MKSPLHTLAPLVAGVLLSAGVSGCKREEPKPTSPPAAATGAASAGPPTKAYTHPAADQLGTLPEGIGLPVGAALPDVSLSDAEGRQVSLRELGSRGPLLVIFYRGGWCPFCNFQIRELTTAFPEFRRRGVTPVALSVDRIEEAAKTRATYEIPFPVLSDPDLVAHRAFRVVRHVDDAEFARLKNMGLDIEAASGRDHHMLAVSAAFIITEGEVRWAHADQDYKKRPSVAQLLHALDQLPR
ncbi:AhpC/TSA family protein [Myxococcus sp. AM001]|uniref:peroxiredoxin-like family protein n=1 Tax=Myxococcus vastator TaxID=2709664 RepID=UPI0013D8127F|nr:peroxiredoxin-like family protein [Myxococcus vastator]NVJ08307.1 AhpC/TSA family protein [Myxococcus sp. AM001]